MESPFSNSELTTILVIREMKSALHFYIDCLGATLIREYGGDSAVVKFLGNWILLVNAGGPTEDKPTIYYKPIKDPNHVSHSFTIRVNDCNKSYDILKAKGVEFITPPYDWGREIRCFFKDPDGHLFEISEFKGE